jgi:hypothetical protein
LLPPLLFTPNSRGSGTPQSARDISLTRHAGLILINLAAELLSRSADAVHVELEVKSRQKIEQADTRKCLDYTLDQATPLATISGRPGGSPA